MGSPVTVDAPRLRAQTCQILAYWADRDLQSTEWIREIPPQPFGNTMYTHVGLVYDVLDVQPSLSDHIGLIVATPSEVRRMERLELALDELLALESTDDNDPGTFFDQPLWHEINKLALDALTLMITNGGSWDITEEIVINESHLVHDYPRRGLATQCLASLADPGGDDEPTPPLRREFDGAIRILRDHCSLADPNAAIDRIYRNGPEIPRLERLSSAVEQQETLATIGDLAGRALTAIVHEGAGSNYDQPIDR